MRKAIVAIVAAATLAAATMTVPTTANAYCHGCGIVGGVIGGLAAGAIIGSAVAGHRGYYTYDYDAPPPYRCDGYWARRRIYNRWGRPIGWSRPHWFCR
jgi:hypothetical protein